jgi:mannonate dehydratase
MATAVTVTGLYSCKNSGDNSEDKMKQTPSPGSDVKWPVTFGPDRPKICVGIGAGDTKSMRQYKQAGVDYVLMGGPKKVPWTEQSLRETMDPFKTEGLTVINMMIGGNQNIIYGRDGRDVELKNIQDSIVAAGKVGLPVVEYNFYAHRFMAGYYEVLARGGSGVTAFDYERAKNVPVDEGTNIREVEGMLPRLTMLPILKQ